MKQYSLAYLTIPGTQPVDQIRIAKEAGYDERLYYVGLDSLPEALQRIQTRVAKGGHDIPRQDVARRFARRFEDVAKVLPYCDEAKFFDNDNGVVLVAEDRNGELLPVGEARPAWLCELLKALK